MTSLAVLGAGQWGTNLVRVFGELGALRTVCDLDPAAGKRVAALAPAAAFTTDPEAILADPAITAVAIATPAATHAALVKRALSAGKDVFVEKPLALSVDDAAPLVRLADEGGRILMVGHVLRYHPAVVRLCKMVQDGDLGKVHYVYSHRLNIGRVRTEEN